jgi:hypothetical protein
MKYSVSIIAHLRRKEKRHESSIVIEVPVVFFNPFHEIIFKIVSARFIATALRPFFLTSNIIVDVNDKQQMKE